MNLSVYNPNPKIPRSVKSVLLFIFFASNIFKLYLFGSAFVVCDIFAIFWLIYQYTLVLSNNKAVNKHLNQFLLYSIGFVFIFSLLSYLYRGRIIDIPYCVRIVLTVLSALFLHYAVFNNKYLKGINIDSVYFYTFIFYFVIIGGNYFGFFDVENFIRNFLYITEPKSLTGSGFVLLLILSLKTRDNPKNYLLFFLVSLVPMFLLSSRGTMLCVVLFVLTYLPFRYILLSGGIIAGVVTILWSTFDEMIFGSTISNGARSALTMSVFYLTKDWTDVIFGMGQKLWVSRLYSLIDISDQTLTIEFIESANPHNLVAEAYLRGGVSFVLYLPFMFLSFIDTKKFKYILPAIAACLLTTGTATDRLIISYFIGRIVKSNIDKTNEYRVA